MVIFLKTVYNTYKNQWGEWSGDKLIEEEAQSPNLMVLTGFGDYAYHRKAVTEATKNEV